MTGDGAERAAAARVIARNVAAVKDGIAAACARAGRDPAAVRLVAVTKTVDAERVVAALDAGVEFIGENRLQEAVDKMAAVRRGRWHFIGTLQRNKARRVAELFELIHSVDSLRLAEALHRVGVERGRPIDVLLEVNLGGEATKSGIGPKEVEAVARALPAFDGLRVRGLMCLPPYAPDPEESRPFFRALARTAQRIAALDLPRISMAELSMGMSHDYEVAVEEGATFVRVGTRLFGERS